MTRKIERCLRERAAEDLMYDSLPGGLRAVVMIKKQLEGKQLTCVNRCFRSWRVINAIFANVVWAVFCIAQVTLEVAHEGGARNPDPQQAAQVSLFWHVRCGLNAFLMSITENEQDMLQPFSRARASCLVAFQANRPSRLPSSTLIISKAQMQETNK